jgi:hypothetical protein
MNGRSIVKAVAVVAAFGALAGCARWTESPSGSASPAATEPESPHRPIQDLVGVWDGLLFGEQQETRAGVKSDQRATLTIRADGTWTMLTQSELGKQWTSSGQIRVSGRDVVLDGTVVAGERAFVGKPVRYHVRQQGGRWVAGWGDTFFEGRKVLTGAGLKRIG